MLIENTTQINVYEIKDGGVSIWIGTNEYTIEELLAWLNQLQSKN
jgi:hypothetical protein